MKKIKKFTLSNGLRLLIYEDHRLPLISMTATFRGGLLAENIKTNGLTHLFKKTIIKGTLNKNAEEIAQILEQVGGTIAGGSCQCGCASYIGENDSFSVSLDVMSPYFQLGLELLAEIITEPIFPEVEVNREKKKQLAAIKAEEDFIGKVAFKLSQKKLFGIHPYAQNQLGTVESVESFNSEILHQFYKKYLVGKNGVIAVFGDVKIEEILSLATKVFANISSGELAFSSPAVVAPLTVPLYEKAIQLREQSVIMKGFLGTTLNNPERPVIELLAATCSGLGSRLFKQIRDKMALVYFVNCGISFGLASGRIDFSLGTDPKKSAIALDELNRCIDQLVQDGLTFQELNEAKKKTMYIEALSRQSNSAFGKEVANNELMGLGFEHTHRRSDEINNVTLEQVNHVVKKYLGVPNFVEVVVGA